jgi:SAM-dependent methyltransferase
MVESQKAIWDARAKDLEGWDDDPDNFFTIRAGHVAEFIRSAVPAGRSLEVGCGAGLLLAHMLTDGYDAYACDLSDGMVESTRARVEQLVDDAVSRVRVSTEDCLPFHDDFDLVVAIGVFPYVEDYAGFLRMLSRKLNSGGYVCAQCAQRFSLYAFLEAARALRRRTPRTAWNMLRTGVWSGGNVDPASARQCYSAHSFDRLFTNAGFERVDDFGMYCSNRLDRAALTRSRTGRFFARRLGWSYVALYRKQPAPAR